MIRVGLVRTGTFKRTNLRYHGIFYKEFENVHSFVKYMSKAYPRVAIADDSSMTVDQRRAFVRKNRAISNKKNKIKG